MDANHHVPGKECIIKKTGLRNYIISLKCWQVGRLVKRKN